MPGVANASEATCQYFNWIVSVRLSLRHGCDVTELQHVLWERGYNVYHKVHSGKGLLCLTK